MLEHSDEDGSVYTDSGDWNEDYNSFDDVVARLDDSEWEARCAALAVARLDDSEWEARCAALAALGTLEPVTLAQYADPVVERLGDAHACVRQEALWTLGELEPAKIAQHGDALIARLEDDVEQVRHKALEMLGKLEPVTLAQHANAVIARLEDSNDFVRREALTTLKALPLAVTRDIDIDLRSSDVRSRLLGRLAWYNYRIRVRVKRIALYWYALPYRPSGPGYARDVEAWGRMVEE